MSTKTFISPKKEKEFLEKIFSPSLKTGENLTLISFPHYGISKLLKYLSQKSDWWQKKYPMAKIFYLNLKNPIIEQGLGFSIFFEITRRSTYDVSSSQLIIFKIKEKIEELIREKKRLIFILDDFDFLDPSIPNLNLINLLYETFKPNVCFVFAVKKNFLEKENLEKYSMIKILLSQNFYYPTLFDHQSSLLSIKTLAKKYSYRIDEKIIELTEKLSGGYPGLFRNILSFFCFKKDYSSSPSKILGQLIKRESIKIILEDIWQSFSSEEKDFLYNLSKNNGKFKAANIPLLLLEIGIVKKERDNKFLLFSPLMKKFIEQKNYRKPYDLKIDPETNEIIFNSGEPIKEKFIFQQYQVLYVLLKEKNKIVSRDKIAEIIWGKKFLDKYSDWAIDQLICRLRKKLKKIGIQPEKLQTIKKKGFRWLE